MQIAYISAALSKTGVEDDGAQILDRKLVAALRSDVVEVDQIPLVRQRGFRLPIWRSSSVSPNELARIRAARDAGACLVVSHEAFFGITEHVTADVLIVHNYLPGFSFPSHRWLEHYYSLRARDYMGNAFRKARVIIFVSYRDRTMALSDFPDIADRAHVLPPPPQPIELGARRTDVIHVSGSEKWFPKRLSRLKGTEIVLLQDAGFKLSDFAEASFPAFGLITDRFSVGFKLKLMQMIHCTDVIASLADIKEEMDAIAPSYPHWRYVRCVSEAADWFQEMRDTSRTLGLDKDFEEHSNDWVVPDWPGTGLKLAKLINMA